MPTYSLYQVDAFASQPLGGNPCAIVFESADLSEQDLLTADQYFLAVFFNGRAAAEELIRIHIKIMRFSIDTILSAAKVGDSLKIINEQA